MKTYLSLPAMAATAAWVTLMATGSGQVPEKQFFVPPGGPPGPFEVDGQTMLVSPAAGQPGVRVLVEQNGQWTKTADLVSSSWLSTDAFGDSFGVSGTVAVVGAWNRQPDGAAYVFEEIGGKWVETAVLAVPAAESPQVLGWTVAVGNGTVAVGDPYTHHAGLYAGAVHIYENVQGTWQRVETVYPIGQLAYSHFGKALAISGDLMVVGAPNQATGGYARGAAYVYERITGKWQLSTTLFGNDPLIYTSQFGRSVAVADGVIVVAGQPGYDPVFVFEKSGEAWTQSGRLVSPFEPKWPPVPLGMHLEFGFSVATKGGTVAVGAPCFDPYGDLYWIRGATYVYAREGAHWELQSELRALQYVVAYSHLGRDVAVRDGDVIASNSDGLRVFTAGPRFATYGAGCGSGSVFGQPLLAAAGDASAGGEISLGLWNCPADKAAFLVLGTQAVSIPTASGCPLLVGGIGPLVIGPYPLLFPVVGAGGYPYQASVGVHATLPASTPAGLTIVLQAFIPELDAAAAEGDMTSNAVKIVTK